MKIILTGGGTGGHFYPIIAVAGAIYDLVEEERLLAPEIIFVSDSPYDKQALKNASIAYREVYAGKVRNYISFRNFIDVIKTGLGVFGATWMIYKEMPDVIFGKGGYASFPILFAAKLFGIPVILHESDSVPGKVNKWASSFAQKIAISFSETFDYFPKEITALTGTPVRNSILGAERGEGKELFSIEEQIPTILILGGSQGAQIINEVLLDILGEFVKHYQIIHQCGIKNEREVKYRAEVVLENSIFKSRYHLFSRFDDFHLRNASSVADVIISRAGGSAIYEIASWGIPSIIIPIDRSPQNHQVKNAYNYSRTGAAEVIEENNLTPHILLSETQSLLSNKQKMATMKEAALKFSKEKAARKIAQEILNLALKHSK